MRLHTLMCGDPPAMLLEALEKLHTAGVYDGEYTEHHEGLLGLYVDSWTSKKVDRLDELTVAYDDDRPIGVCAVERRPGYVNGNSRVIRLIHCYVQPEYRRRGLATRMLTRLFTTLPPHSKRFGYITDTGQRLYEQFGIVPYGQYVPVAMEITDGSAVVSMAETVPLEVSFHIDRFKSPSR